MLYSIDGDGAGGTDSFTSNLVGGVGGERSVGLIPIAFFGKGSMSLAPLASGGGGGGGPPPAVTMVPPVGAVETRIP